MGIDTFLEQIIAIKVLRMGGAAAAILGSAGSDSDMVNDLKRAAVAFASEYRKSQPDPAVVRQRADDIEGLINMLQVTSVISQQKAAELVALLHSL